ncbi:S41 family peptidase [Dokdonella ginsengisoli]|uniref:S41 family peptidase n=1 Tax=Dokdonella ginsengisoli TaxID=363846 RepID=A0ABV9QP30_9GAMM
MLPIRRRGMRLGPVLLLLLAAQAGAAAPAAAPVALSAAQAREDVQLAADAAEAALTDPFWHQSREEWTAARASALAEAEKARDPMRVYAIVATLMAHLGEGHLTVRPPAAAIEHQRRTAAVLPLDLHWSGEGIFVVAGHGDAADIAHGSRLLSIDGEGEDALLAELASMIPRDGRILTGPMRDGAGKGYAVLRHRRRGDEARFELRWRAPDGTVVQRTAAAFPLRRWPAAKDEEESRVATLEWLAPSLAYLVVPSFSNRVYRAAGLDFRDEMRRIFEELRRGRATRLILDLRQNGGGSEPNESILFSHLVAEPLRKYAAVEARGEELAVSSRSGRRYDHRVFDADELNFQQLLPDGRLSRLNVPPEGLMTHWEPATPVFSGRLVVLAGGATFSGGAELASMLYHVRRGVFVGEETGGAHEGNASGYTWEIELPHSGVRLHLPLLQFRFAWPGLPRNRGVPPDCAAPPRVEEIGVRRDRAWRIARDVVEQEWATPDEARCPAAAD